MLHLYKYNNIITKDGHLSWHTSKSFELALEYVAMAQATVIGHQLSGDSPSLVVKALFPFLVPFLLLFVLLRYFSTGATINNNNQRKRPPPSPPALPLIGHLHLVRAHPHVSMRSLAARHGGEDLMLLRLGTVPTLVASSPRAAQAVLRTHDQSLASRPSSIFGDILGYGPSDVGLAPYGNAWRQAKKLVTTHLLSTKKVQSYRAAREEEVGVVIDKIRSAAMADAGGVDLTELLSLFTTDMVSRAVAGGSFRVGGLDKMFKEVMDASMALLGGFSLENFYPGLAKVAGGVLMWPGRRRAEKLRDRWDEVLDKVIDQHASMAADGAPAPDESDFTDVLLSVQEEYGLTRDSIKAILAVSSLPTSKFHFICYYFSVNFMHEPYRTISSSNCLIICIANLIVLILSYYIYFL